MLDKLKNNIVMAVPKGRIMQELAPVLAKLDIIIEDAFYDDSSRQLIFKTNYKNLSIIRVRSFDVATFVAFGGADIAIAGIDVIKEFGYDAIYTPLNLNIGKCRLSVAALKNDVKKIDKLTSVKVATKYPGLTKEYFSSLGVQCETIKLNGAMEIAPMMGLTDYIVDLVSTGKTLKENKLVEVDKILDISSYLVVNKNVMLSKLEDVMQIIEKFKCNLK